MSKVLWMPILVEMLSNKGWRGQGRAGPAAIECWWLGAISLFLDSWAPMAYMPTIIEGLITVAETLVFIRQSKEIWTEVEHDEFVLYIAGNPEAGVVIPDSGGVRKVRWSRASAANEVAFA
jgi:L-lactate permease